MTLIQMPKAISNIGISIVATGVHARNGRPFTRGPQPPFNINILFSSIAIYIIKIFMVQVAILIRASIRRWDDARAPIQYKDIILPV